MNNNRALRLHKKAELFLKVYFRLEERIKEVKKDYSDFLKARPWQDIRLFNVDSDFTDRIEKDEFLKGKVMLRYKDVMLKLYSPEYSKTENLWQTLAATKLFLEIKSPITPEFIEELKKVLNDNRP